MNSKEVLEKIVAEEGSCTWAIPSNCEVCPLSKLKTKNDGSFMSCVEALDAFKLGSKKEVDEKYKDTAQRILADMAIDDIIG